MKKLIASVIVAVLILAMAVSASAINNLDRIFVNEESNKAGATDVKLNNPIEINEGDKMYILGWSNIDGGLKKVVYTVDGGDDHECEDNYKTRPDLAAANISSYNDGEHAGFGWNDTEEDHPGAMELLGINELKAGTYTIALICVSNSDARETMSEFKLKVNAAAEATEQPADETTEQPADETTEQPAGETTEAPAEDTKAETPAEETKGEDKPGTNPNTADASVIAIAAMACVTLAGAVIIGKKVK